MWGWIHVSFLGLARPDPTGLATRNSPMDPFPRPGFRAGSQCPSEQGTQVLVIHHRSLLNRVFFWPLTLDHAFGDPTRGKQPLTTCLLGSLRHSNPSTMVKVAVPWRLEASPSGGVQVSFGLVHEWEENGDWQMDWSSVGSDANAEAVCCGEVRAEPEGKSFQFR